MKRPDHPDFWLLAKVVQNLDRIADESAEKDMVLTQEVSKHIDPGSCEYMATQRAMRAFGAETAAQLTQKFEEVVRGAALHMEGFIVGYRLAEQAIKDTPLYEMGEMEVRLLTSMYDIYVQKCYDENKRPLPIKEWMKTRE